MARILIIDDEQSMRSVLEKLFTAHGHNCTVSSGGHEGLEVVRTTPYDLITLDMRMPDMTGMEVLYELRKGKIDTPIIMITAHATPEEVNYALELDVYDVIFKPFDVSEMLYTVNALLGSRGIKITAGELEASSHKNAPVEHGHFIAKSPKMKQACDAMMTAAKHDRPLTIIAGHGTDKERVAQAVHENSKRHDKPVLCLDCSTLDEAEFLNHIFGGKDGADGEGHGALELADQGTLLLDHAEKLPPFIQEQLASYIEAHMPRPGMNKNRPKHNARIIFGLTPAQLSKIKEAGFNERLLGLILKDMIIIPLLRERADDILPLAMHYLADHFEKPPFLSPETKARLAAYQWPCNERELEDMMRVIAETVPSGAIYAQNLPERLQEMVIHDKIKPDPRVELDKVAGRNIRDFLATYLKS